MRARALVGLLAFGIFSLIVGLNHSYLREWWHWFTTIRPYMLVQVRPHVLTAEAERALKPVDSFRECAKDCPEMVVIPRGEFMMGSPANEKGRYPIEGPQHKVGLAKPFAVSKFEITFGEWDACVAHGDCNPRVSDAGWGRGRQPVIHVTWDDAQAYAAWLSKMTGKAYRLLSEAEWEYAARAGTQAAYSWGDEIGIGNANCDGCGSRWDNKQTAPVGSFPANAFGLHDMHGNIWEWVEDCYHGDYDGAPIDGSPWTARGDCTRRIVRGGCWYFNPQDLRSASRHGIAPVFRLDYLGFRVGRTLTP